MSFASSVHSTRSHSSAGIASMSTSANNGEDDDELPTFDCQSDMAAYFKINKSTQITQTRMESNYFKSRLDGKRHASLPTPKSRCQYCRYQFTHVLTDALREFYREMYDNRDHGRCRRCLVCNVNLCSKCEMKFHGIRYDTLSKQLMHKK